ncbi:MAG: DUF58 domain-containing protein [Phycisphaeraceae bacterium]
MQPDHTHDYLDPRTLAAIGPIELRARMIVEGMMTGMHRSPMEGVSVEFAQHRQYTPGDDTRFLDWKVYGKTDKLYLKQYQKETNLDMVVLVDVSGSMNFSSTRGLIATGSPRTRPGISWSKYDHAASLAAAMCHIALRQQDRAAVVTFTDSIRVATRLSNAHSHWRTIVEALSLAQQELQAGGTAGQELAHTQSRTELGRVFDQAVAKLTRRSLVILISDLFDDPSVFERGLARMKYRGHDLIVLQTLDPAELNFPFRGPTQFIDLEADGRLNLDPQALKSAYLDALQRHLDQVEALTRRFQFDYMLLNTGEPLGPALSHFMARRGATIGRRT